MKEQYTSNCKCLSLLFKSKMILVLACFGILVFSGCSQYQYISMNSNLKQNDNREYISENDTVQTKYIFAGRDCPMRVKIYNKLQIPLYIDWSRSALIIDTDQVSDPFYHDSTYSLIDPHASIELSGILVQNCFIPTSPNDSAAKVLIYTNCGTTEVTRYSYTPDTSPLYARCYLVLSTLEDGSAPCYIDDQFWVSDIKKTMACPASLAYKPYNEFYVKKTTTYGKILGVLGVVLLSVLRFY